MKKLSEMTLEELWALFPIILTEHRAEWADWFAEEKALLDSLLPEARISHIGSTAIRDIWAKPIVDILVETADDADWQSIRETLTVQCGYICMSAGQERMSFNKGYTPVGFAEKVFHLHLRRRGDNDELYFRDYMNEHPEAAQAYERLKLDLWKPYEHDRDGYTAQKAEMVAQYTQTARELYGARY